MHSYFGFVEADCIAHTGDIIADVSSTVRGTGRQRKKKEREKEFSSLGEERTRRMIKLIYRIACFRQDRL